MSDPILTTRIYPDKTVVQAGRACPLVEVTNALTGAYSTLLCKGVYRFATTRDRAGDDLILRIAHEAPAKPLEFANYVALHAAVAEGVLPVALKPDEILKPGEDDQTYTVKIGHMRHPRGQDYVLGKKAGKGGKSILQQHDLNNISIAENGYYLAEFTLSFLFAGATTHRILFSRKLLQHFIDYGFAKGELEGMLTGSSPTYPIRGTVAALV